MILVLLACGAVPAPASDRMNLDGPCAPTPDWDATFVGWVEFVEGGDMEGDGRLDLDLSSADGAVSGTLLLSGDVSVKGVAIEEGRGWQVDVEGSSCWDDAAEEDLTIRLASPVVDTAAGWIEASKGNPACDGWFPDGEVYEYVDLWQGPDVIPFFGGLS